MAGCEMSGAGLSSRGKRDVSTPILSAQARKGELGIMGVAALGLVGDQQLHDHVARRGGARVLRVDLHAGRGLADARGGQHALALDLDHAGAAVAVGAVAGRVLPAQMRDRGAEALGRLPDGLARQGLDLAPVEDEGDGFGHHEISFGKYFITERMGFGAAWPRPQIEASAMAVDSSFSRSVSQRSLLHELDGLLAADPAGRALAAGLVLEELEQVDRHARHRVLVRQDHDGVRADKGAVRLERAEIERQIGHAAGRMPPDAPPGK
jgi:hypothetical protein